MQQMYTLIALLSLFASASAFHHVGSSRWLPRGSSASVAGVSSFSSPSSAIRKQPSRALRLADVSDAPSATETTTAETAVVSNDDSMMSMLKEGFKQPTNLNGSDVRVGIIMARWNSDVISGLYKGVNASLTAAGVKPSNVFTTFVPGSYELPITAKFLAASKRVDVIICLGCLIKGDTMHFEYIAQSVSEGIMKVSLDSFVPCIFGVLTVLNKEQAVVRSSGDKNEGLNWGTSAVEMGLARMSAMGSAGAKKQMASTTPFTTFNATGIPAPTDKDGKSAEKKKTFGF